MAKKLIETMFKIHDNIISSFPADSISVADISSPEGYQIVDVSYHKPLGDIRNAELNITVQDKKNALHNINKIIRFAHSENERVADSISPRSFQLIDSIQQSSSPDELHPSHFKSKYSDVSIMSVEYKKPPINEKETVVTLIVKLISLNSTMPVHVPISFRQSKEQEVLESLTSDDFKIITKVDSKYKLIIEAIDYLGKYDINIIQSKIDIIQKKEIALVEIEVQFGSKVRWVRFPISYSISQETIEMNKYMNMVFVKSEFLQGTSPIHPSSDLISFPKQLKIVSFNFIPPKTFSDKEAKANLVFSFKKEVGKLTLSFKFSKSVKEVADEIYSNISPNDINYLRTDVVAPPEKFSTKDFEININDLNIKEIKYDFSKVQPSDDQVNVKIVCDYHGIKMDFIKSLTFKYSIIDYITSQKLVEKINFHNIKIPRDLKKPDMIKKLYEKSETISKKTLNEFYVAKPYSFKVVGVRVKSFNIKSKDVVFILSVSETIDGKTIDREIERPIKLKESYAEQQIMTLTEQALVINRFAMSPFPPDKLDDNLFVKNPLFKILGTHYIRPAMDSNVAQITVQIAAGDKQNYIRKNIHYDYSRLEFRKKLWAEDNEKFIKSINPSKLNLHVNILGEPVDRITTNDISGIPEGIKAKTQYKKPQYGQKDADLTIELFKGDSKVAFTQTITFALPKSKGDGDNSKLRRMKSKSFTLGKRKEKRKLFQRNKAK